MAIDFGGVFMGTTMLQAHHTLGGAKSVFVKLRGEKNDLVFPTHGGKLMNPFKGAAKIFAGDLMEYRADNNGQNPSIYLLKTYKVAASVASTAKTITIVKDGFKHIPFVGDVLMVAPSVLGGTGTGVTVESVSEGTSVWTITVSAALGALSEGAILVEAEAAGSNKAMLVKRINAVAPCDYDCFYAPQSGDSDWEGARYLMVPALGGIMYTSKMSPMPACVAALNGCNVNGWYKVDGLAPSLASVADHEVRIKALENA